MNPLDIELSNLKEELEIAKPTYKKLLLAIEERKQIKLKCNEEISEIYKLMRETFASS